MASFDKGVTPYIIGWSKDDSQLIFETGRYKEELEHEIWRISADGGEPIKVIHFDDIFSQGTVMHIEIHPDGEQIVIDAQTGNELQVWALDNIF